MEFITSSVRLVRWVGLVEGISYLVLLCIAMPLKYFVGIPKAVSIVGMAHGVLFVMFCAVLLMAFLSRRLSFCWCVIAFIASLIPLGFFLIDKKLAALDQRS